MNAKEMNEFDMQLQALSEEDKKRYASVELVKVLNKLLAIYKIANNSSKNPTPEWDYEIWVDNPDESHYEIIDTANHLWSKAYKDVDFSESKPIYEFLETLRNVEHNGVLTELHGATLKDFLKQKAQLHKYLRPETEKKDKAYRDRLIDELKNRQFQAYLSALEKGLNDYLDTIEQEYNLVPNAYHKDDEDFAYEISNGSLHSVVNEAYYSYLQLSNLHPEEKYDGIRMFLEYVLVANDSDKSVEIPNEVVEVYTYDKNNLKQTPNQEFMIDWSTRLPDQYVLNYWKQKRLPF
jgi:hypothetical protein